MAKSIYAICEELIALGMEISSNGYTYCTGTIQKPKYFVYKECLSNFRKIQFLYFILLIYIKGEFSQRELF